jgi:hypothetical protein
VVDSVAHDVEQRHCGKELDAARWIEGDEAQLAGGLFRRRLCGSAAADVPVVPVSKIWIELSRTQRRRNQKSIDSGEIEGNWPIKIGE